MVAEEKLNKLEKRIDQLKYQRESKMKKQHGFIQALIDLHSPEVKTQS